MLTSHTNPKKTLCDVILMVQERKIPAHRVVLAAASHFFNLMFTSKYLKIKHNIFSEILVRSKWKYAVFIFNMPVLKALRP